MAISKNNGVSNIMEFGAIGNGIVDDSPAILKAINSGITDLQFPAGVYRISQNLILPAANIMRFNYGAMLSIDEGKTVTVSYIDAGTYQIFNGKGKVVLNSSLEAVYPQWWGASGSEKTTTGTITANSNQVTVSSIEDFEIGQDIAIANAGAVNSITFMEVLTPPTAAGNLDLTVEGTTYTVPLTPIPQIFELTMTGTSPTQREFGIVLEYETHYVTVFAGETAIQFANRIRTDGYFTNLWPTWTIGGVADTNVITFTSRYTGARLWGTQTFGYSGFEGTFTQKQAGTGGIGYVAYRLADVIKISGYTQKRLNDTTAMATKNVKGPVAPITYNAYATGVTIDITQKIDGIGNHIATITAIDPVNKVLTLSSAANYTVTDALVRHDDSRPLQTALDIMGVAGGGKIIVPDGTYNHYGLYFRDKVSFIGNSMSKTILVNYSRLWSSLYVQGIGGSVGSEPGFLDHWEISGMTITTDKGSNPVPTQNGLDLLFCHSVIVRDVNIRKHGIGVYEKCVWYTEYENIYINQCIDGWVYPEFNPSSSPSSRKNIIIADNSGYGMTLNSPDVFTWIGGAVERNKLGGIKIVGGTTRSLMFEGINLEENGGYQLEIGEEAGVAPTGVSFRNCSFKNWQSTKPRCAILLNRIIGFELQNPKFFNFDIGLIAEVTGSSFVITLPSFDGCRMAFKFTDLEVSTGHNMIVGDWGGVVGITSKGFQQIGSQYLKTNPIAIGDIATLIANGGSGSGGALTPAQRGFVHSAIDFGTLGTGVDGDDTKLQAALDKACELRLPLYIPAGDYKLTFGLVADSSKSSFTGDRNIMIYGAGGTATRLMPTATTFNALTIQNSSAGSGSGIAPSGFIKDIYIEGPTSHPTGTNIGLLLRGMRQFEVHNVTVKKMPIGFDMIDNCYGCAYYNCKAQLVSVGLNLRAGSVSGSDMNFYNFWIRANIAAVHISPDGGGWHFFGGQLAGGDVRTVDDDNAGAIIIGKDYISSATGTSSNIIFDGIDFEGTKYMHNFRSHGQITMTVRNCSFLQTDSSGGGLLAASLAIWKATGAQQSKVVFENNGVKGYWKSAKAIDVAGHGSLIEIHERATLYESNVKFNNVAWTAGPMLVQSKCNLGHAHWRDSWVSKYLVGGTIYREASGKLEQSTDWGTTWTGTSTSSSIADSLKIGTTGTAQILTQSTLLANYSLATAIPGLSVPAQTTIDIDLTLASALLNDDVSVVIDAMPLGLMWAATVEQAGKVRLRIANITNNAVAITDMHNIRITLNRFA
ncbi:Pectate lyase superfamily protein [compost metagenome]